MDSLTIALIMGGWVIAALLVLRLFAAASRSDANERASAEPAAEQERVRQHRFQPQPEGSARDVAAAGPER
jgi:hypothetical protein